MEKLIGILIAVALVASVAWNATRPVAVENLPDSLQGRTALVYFGTKDCGYCQGFVRDGLSEARRLARRNGYDFVRREIASLRDLGRQGAYGSWDGLHRAAVRKAGRNAVPMFAVVDDGRLVAAQTGDWRSMSDKAAAAAKGG